MTAPDKPPAVVWVVETRAPGGAWDPDEMFVTRDNAESFVAWLKIFLSGDEYRIARYVREEPTPIESSPLTDEERKALTECEERET